MTKNEKAYAKTHQNKTLKQLSESFVDTKWLSWGSRAYDEATKENNIIRAVIKAKANDDAVVPSLAAIDACLR